MRRAAVAAAVRHENVAAAVAAPPVPMPPVAPPPGVAEAAQAAVQVAATVSQQVPLFQHLAHLLLSMSAPAIAGENMHCVHQSCMHVSWKCTHCQKKWRKPHPGSGRGDWQASILRKVTEGADRAGIK